jgi:hypothetical protein
MFFNIHVSALAHKDRTAEPPVDRLQHTIKYRRQHYVGVDEAKSAVHRERFSPRKQVIDTRTSSLGSQQHWLVTRADFSGSFPNTVLVTKQQDLGVGHGPEPAVQRVELDDPDLPDEGLWDREERNHRVTLRGSWRASVIK